MKGDEHRYDDMINLPHHVSQTRPHMPVAERAAQFAPFAALTGYDAAVAETARLTDTKLELDENALVALNERLRIIKSLLPDCPEVRITYFVPDEKKAGGAYVTKTGCVRLIDEYKRRIVMQSGAPVPLDDIAAIDGEVFECLENAGE